MITSAPTGISWDIIPYPQAILALQEAEQLNICFRAMGLVNGYCNQILRATVDTEQLSGPNYRVTIEQDTGNTRIILSRWPITQILAAQFAPNAVMPRQWTQVTSGNWDIEYPIIGVYNSSTPSSSGEGGQSILLGTNNLDWSLGRNGYRVSVSYVNGWPHCGTTASSNAGVSALQVDDVTAFAGAGAFIYDGANTEEVHVSTVVATTPLVLPNGGGIAQAGPGTINLRSPTAFSHGSGVVVSSLPQDILWATILAATTQALESGIDAITIQNIPGSQTVGGHGVSDLTLSWKTILKPFKRTI